jgi:hypothetical protein
MPSYGKVLVVFASLSVVGCTQDGEAAAKADDFARLSPDVFSHDDQAAIADQDCLGRTGVLITATSIGPVTVGTPLSQLRKRCRVASVNVPQSVAVQGPVMGVSAGGGLIVFTVAGKDSVIETAGSSNPAFRTSNGIGVGTAARGLSVRQPRVCFVRDSSRVTRVIVSRRALSCR